MILSTIRVSDPRVYRRKLPHPSRGEAPSLAIYTLTLILKPNTPSVRDLIVRYAHGSIYSPLSGELGGNGEGLMDV